MERIAKAVAVAIVLFFVALGIVVGTKVDQNTIALLGGTVVGLLIATPCAAIATYVSMRRREENHGYERDMRSYERGPRYQGPTNSPMPQNPPQYWVIPPHLQQPSMQPAMQASMQQTMPNMGMQQFAPQLPQPMTMAAYGMRPNTMPDYMLPAQKRRFYVIGETGDVQEVDENNPTGSTQNFDD